MGTLTLVGTSIGNYDDISPRALATIASADIVLAEDTRVFGKLKSLMLDRNPAIEFKADQKVISYREQNHDRVIGEIVQYIAEERKVVQLSDAGMPSISDPGYRLVNAVLEAGLEVDVVPSATAIETALVLSGLPTDKFIFLGFLPRKSGKIKKIIDEVINLDYTIVLYESPFRVHKLLELLEETYGEDIQVAACNELTKKFQKIFRGSIHEVSKELPTKLKGEWVVILKS